MCYVYKDGEHILYKHELTIKEQEDLKDNLLEVVFSNGKLIKGYSLSEIRKDLYGEF